MKILYLTDDIPYPPDNGIRIVPFNAMRLMRDRGHEVRLCALTVGVADDKASFDARFSALSEIISADSWWMRIKKRHRYTQIVDTLCGRLSYIEQYKSSSFANRLLKTLDEFQPDVVHFDYINMTQYIDCLPSGAGSIASVNDSHTLALKNRLATGSFPGLQKYVKKIQLSLTRRYEVKVYEKFGYTHLMTEVDANFLRSMNSKIRTCVIPNGVDGELFSVESGDQYNSSIIFVGKLIEYNLVSLKRFVVDGWPLVKRGASRCTLKIFGEITSEAQSWVDFIRTTEPDIKFMGYIPRLVDAYENSSISIVPIDKTTGIINKVIEAMAAGVAVVGFSSVFQGMSQAEEGVNYLGGASYAALGKGVKRLLDNSDERMSIARAGRSLAEKHYAWPAKGGEFEAMYLAAKQLALTYP